MVRAKLLTVLPLVAAELQLARGDVACLLADRHVPCVQPSAPSRHSAWHCKGSRGRQESDCVRGQLQGDVQAWIEMREWDRAHRDGTGKNELGSGRGRWSVEGGSKVLDVQGTGEQEHCDGDK